MHPVDRLKEVRDQIKTLQKEEESLVKAISLIMGNADICYGELLMAKQIVQNRKGSIDPLAIKLKGFDPDSFRKPGITVYSLKIEPIPLDILLKMR